LAPDHWRVDVVPIYATTLLSLWLTVKLAREERARSDVSTVR
jgi:hypothetical protein